MRHLATQHRQRNTEGLHAEPKEEQHNAPPSPSHRYRHPTSKRRATATRSGPHVAHRPPAWSHPPTLVPTPHRSVCALDQQTSTLSAIRHPLSAIRAGVNTAPQRRDGTRTPTISGPHTRPGSDSHCRQSTPIKSLQSLLPAYLPPILLASAWRGAQCLSLVLGQHHWTGKPGAPIGLHHRLRCYCSPATGLRFRSAAQNRAER